MTREEVFSYNKHIPTPPEKPFYFGVTGLNHGHIYGMCAGLINAGAKMTHIYEPDKALLDTFLKKYPNITVCDSLEELLAVEELELIATAAIPGDRAGIEIKSMRAGKHVFTDKAPMITLEQLEEVKAVSLATGKRLFVYYSEFVAVESAIFAKQLIDRGVIGKVAHIDIFAPHRLNPDSRPDWFWVREKTGGILIDIGSHQFHQFLEYSGTNNATVTSSRVANYFNKQYPGFDDFGDATLTADNGITGYVRIDWMSPAGIQTWGDGKVVILGEKGYIELRKNCDIGKEKVTNTVFVCTDDGVFTESVSGKVGCPYYSNIIKDSREGTELSMSVEQAYNAIELAIKAQTLAM
ncbi:MAG: Gfo/Idh/MocA family oxidoreductase [Clostridia bacterium]|nr:Gfo/Idh/MocA family oxidoreductase [Clostridia bacterium]